MATFNGAPFLEAQLASFVAQTHEDWQLWVSDDGSSDGTMTILDRFSKDHPDRVADIKIGPGMGSTANFLSLLHDPRVAGTWVAFADQDDVWMPHKLTRALGQLKTCGSDCGVYASRSIHTKADLTPLQTSPQFNRPLRIGNAVVQNVLAGNTIVMSPAFASRMQGTVEVAQRHGVPFHDWWVYLVATATNTFIFLDDEPGLYYRQHGQNVMGAGAMRRFDRFRKLTSHQFSDWAAQNIAALLDTEGLLSVEAKSILEALVEWGSQPKKRRPSLGEMGIYRQSRRGDFILSGLARTGLLTFSGMNN